MPSQMVLTPGSLSPFRARQATESGNQAHHLVECGWFVWQFLLVQDVGRLPLIGLEHQLGIQVWATSPQPHQPGDAPGHHHVQHQGALNLLDASQLQRLDAAAVLEHMKKYLDFPARPVPVNHARSLLQAGHRQVRQQPPFDRLVAIGRFRFFGDEASGLHKATLTIGQLHRLAPIPVAPLHAHAGLGAAPA